MAKEMVPFLWLSKLMSPWRQVSVTSEMEQATLPMAWMVAATKALSELAMYVCHARVHNTGMRSTISHTGHMLKSFGVLEVSHQLTLNSLRMEWMLVSPAMLAMISNCIATLTIIMCRCVMITQYNEK